MINKHKSIATGIATMAMFIANSLPVFAATDLVISGNGADSDSTVAVEQSGTTFVTQSNDTHVVNDVNISANTGNNYADDNTNGDVRIDTGDVTSSVLIENMANSNLAEVENCNCDLDASALIQGNGADSDNTTALGISNDTVVTQSNAAHLMSDVDVNAQTGANRAEDSTGGDVIIVTGDVDSTVGIANSANMNTASIMPSESGGSGASLTVSGNGADSDNSIGLYIDNSTWLDQVNATSIDNRVNLRALTGENHADDNTGGITGIGTGDVDATVLIDNMAGFNTASVEDCCVEDAMAKVSGNGAESENAIEALLAVNSTVFQDNSCGMGLDRVMTMMTNSIYDPCFDNGVHLDAVTGANTNDDGTGSVDGDPMIITGDTDTAVEVSNQGGVNSYGVTDAGWDWPSMGFDLSFSFNLQDLLAALR